MLFFDKFEVAPRIGPKSGNTLRQRYILVALPDDMGVAGIHEFERHNVRAKRRWHIIARSSPQK